MEKYVLSTIQGCQTMETAYMFISGKTDKFRRDLGGKSDKMRGAVRGK